MIRLFTGLPGSFKTCRAVRVIKEAVAAGRPVYATNLEGLNVPGVELWEDPKDWQALPTGALLVVDEAQRFWRTSRDLNIPPEIQALETHRHKGIDFLLTTQQPGYLLKHLRGLVGEHVHHIRVGKMRARTLTWNRCCEDLTSSVEAKKADVGFFIATKDDFASYVSTVKDTHKPRINRRHILLAVAAIAICIVFGVVGKALFTSKENALSPKNASEAGQPPQEAGRRGGRDAPLNTEEYMRMHRPRLEIAPWSAPVFDERQPVSNPEMYCIASGAGFDAQGNHQKASAHCITEQGTPLAVREQLAREVATSGGVYNPYRQPIQPQQQPVQQAVSEPLQAPSVQASVTPASHAVVPQQAAYGAMRGQP